MNPLVALARAPIRFYRRFITPWKPRTCRFSPTCSAYALDALGKRGLVMGTLLTVWRLMRCQPYGTPGHDPVPERGFGGVVPRPGAPEPRTLPEEPHAEAPAHRGGNERGPEAP